MFTPAKRLILMGGRRYKNLVANGDFAIDTNADGKADGFDIQIGATCFIDADGQHFTCISANSAYVKFSPPVRVIGHTYYQRYLVKSTSQQVTFNNGRGSAYHSGSNTFEPLAIVSTATALNEPHCMLFDGRTSGWDEITIKNYIDIDLTAEFGAGNEPTKVWCDANIVPNIIY